MKQKFEDHKFGDQATGLIVMAQQILTEYAQQGYRLSLRQLYYQFVARDLLPKSWEDPATGSTNNVRSYKKLGNIICDARMAGLLDWNMIEDRGREPAINAHWTSPGEIVQACANQFRLDHWSNQSNYVEVMVEKDALAGILEPVCRKWDVIFTANKGYSSASAMFEAGLRFSHAIVAGKNAHLFYFGDHDPSGIDMTRDVTDRLIVFAFGEQIDVIRLALNMDQVKIWQPPENPAKETDSRFIAYQDKYGDSSWELDAVEPKTLANLVEDGIKNFIGFSEWDEKEEEQDTMRQKLQEFADENRE
jgi:hypothetical protein